MMKSRNPMTSVQQTKIGARPDASTVRSWVNMHEFSELHKVHNFFLH